MREKLIELLMQKGFGVEGATIAADHLIANGVTFATDNNVGDEWISVKDRLPDKSVTFIAVADSKYDTPMRVVLRDSVREHLFWGESMGYFSHGVQFTHWMPLPEPPKGE